MSAIEIRDMAPESQYFVGTCSHVDDISEHFHRAEVDTSAALRIEWMQQMAGQGLCVKVAFADGRPVGFIHAMPIEVCPWGPLGRDLYVIPCLFVVTSEQGRGAGRLLMEAAEERARQQGAKGLAAVGYYGDFWFMPATFFEACGFRVAQRIKNSALLWKPWDAFAEPPRLLEPQFEYRPVAGRVVIDLFWIRFCPTSAIEAQRVREVAAEFGEVVLLHEYPAEERAVLLCHQIPRGIYVNGQEIGWGHEAPREGIREAIQNAAAQV